MITQTDRDKLLTILHLHRVNHGQDVSDLVSKVEHVHTKSLADMRRDIGKARMMKQKGYDKRMLAYMIESGFGNAEPNDVLKAVESVTGVSVSAILGKARHRPTVDARHMVCGLLYLYCPHFGMIELGRIMGKNYATIIHSIKTFDILTETDAAFATKRQKVEAILNGTK
jgi:chromosomal replication initiation ATPase DnaA